MRFGFLNQATVVIAVWGFKNQNINFLWVDFFLWVKSLETFCCPEGGKALDLSWTVTSRSMWWFFRFSRLLSFFRSNRLDSKASSMLPLIMAPVISLSKTHFLSFVTKTSEQKSVHMSEMTKYAQFHPASSDCPCGIERPQSSKPLPYLLGRA